MKSKAGISSSSFPRRSPSSLLAVAVFLCSVCLHSWSTTGTSTLGSTCSSSVGVGVAAYSGAAATAAFVGPRGYQQQERQPELLRSSSPFRNSASTACTYRRTAAGERNLVLFASNHNNDDSDSDSDTMALNKARTDIRNFLTQRAIQSFLFLLTTCRDEATVHWMEKTYNFRNLDDFHGTAALNLTIYPEWDSLFWDMLMEPPSIVTIRAKRRGRGHGGWSKNNPYMEDEDSRFVDFDIDICPASLVQRIVSVRDQIAGEWTADLETLRVANAMILDSYHTFQSKQRQTEAEARQKKKQQQEATDTKSDDDGDWSEDAKASATASNEANNQLTAPYSSAYDKTFKAYDRTAMMVLGNNIVHDGRSSSAYRTGSFDLLGLLATQESIHRVLRNYRRDSSRGESSSWQWLYQFYVARIPTYFDGNQEYGRADDFLEELLLTPPSVVFASSKTSASTTSGVNFIDPMRMAEDIIAMRSQVVLDWKEIVSRVTVQDHVDLVKMSLAIRMGHTLERSPSMQSLQQQTVGDDSGFQ